MTTRLDRLETAMVTRCRIVVIVCTCFVSGCAATGPLAKWSRGPAKEAAIASRSAETPATGTNPNPTNAGSTNTVTNPGTSNPTPKLASKSTGAAPAVATNTAAEVNPAGPANTGTAVAKLPLPAQPFAADPSIASLAGTAPSGAPAGGISLSPELLHTIDLELRDATPEERTYWYDQLKRVDPSVVPDILRARRLSMQVTETAVAGSLRGQPTRRTISSIQDSSGGTGQAIQLAGHIQTGEEAEGFESGITHAGWEQPADRGRDVVQAYGEEIEGMPHTGVRPVGYRPPPSMPAIRQGARHPAFVAERAPYPEELDSQGMTSQGIAPQRMASSSPMGAWSDPRATDNSGLQNGAQPGEAWPAPPAAPVVIPRSNSTVSRLIPGFGGIVPTSSANEPRGISPASATAASDMSAALTALGSPSTAQLDQLISQFEQGVAEQTPGSTPDEQLEYIRQHVFLRLLYLLADRPERALTAIPGIPPADQEFWQQTLWALTNYFDNTHLPQPASRASQTIAQLGTAIRRLRQQANLEVHNATFSRQILGYGAYSRFPRDEFRPGEEVLLYVEIENFTSEPTPEGEYRTLLRSNLEIVSPTGEVRWQKEFPATEDLCRNPRRDYYHNYQFAIPDRTPLGPQTLKLSVYDELSGKVATTSVNFVVR